MSLADCGASCHTDDASERQWSELIVDAMRIYLSQPRMGWRERSVGVSAASGNGEASPGATLTISITG
jgi:hypothetical protein